MSLLSRIREEAKGYFTKAKGSHDWMHTERVFALCMHIGKKEGVDLEVVGIAALLHDIGRKYQDDTSGEVCHAKKGAELARGLLSRYKMRKETIDKIIDCIECHRFRGDRLPRSKEAKVLYDADKLDSIGAVGVGRAFLFAGEVGAYLHNMEVEVENTAAYSREDTAYREFVIKLRKIKDTMLTKEGKRMAQDRHLFMEGFFERLVREVRGEL